MATFTSSPPLEAIPGIPIEKKTEGVSVQVSAAQPSNFDWVMDKNLLRDEGVYYGLSDANEVPFEKIEAIRHFFQERIKVLEKSIEMLRAEASFCRNEMIERNILVATWRNRLEEMTLALISQPHDFWRYALGILAYATMLFCNFWMIESWLSSSNLTSPGVTAFGLYLFGSLSLFSRASHLYHSNSKLEEASDRRESWKTYLEEWAIPFIVALFVGYQGRTGHNLAESVLFFLLVFSIFLFVGKGAFNTFSLAKTEYIKHLQNQKARRLQREKQVFAREEIVRIDKEAKQLLQKEVEIKEQILEDEKSRAMLLEQQESNVSLFLSEFGLAKGMRNSLNHKQLSQLISTRR